MAELAHWVSDRVLVEADDGLCYDVGLAHPHAWALVSVSYVAIGWSAAVALDGGAAVEGVALASGVALLALLLGMRSLYRRELVAFRAGRVERRGPLAAIARRPDVGELPALESVPLSECRLERVDHPSHLLEIVVDTPGSPLHGRFPVAEVHALEAVRLFGEPGEATTDDERASGGRPTSRWTDPVSWIVVWGAVGGVAMTVRLLVR